ncbi:hypothetical protein N7474_010654 [Penicillium riverlandense]|uniref:uncharacterized protein n=1 Tax=Penicillium riverlandense TaxID=1903569 RepID=UPI00254711DA|nr:uncharacterized protein N7474_010654 [Penicillium riverlandense]KAJ5807062.1 hypothetical protein N7474_010654 [Penicillium riverlandense]
MQTGNTGGVKELRPASSARVRENQRRSRARRKEYTQFLEEKLRSFERLGVAASQEVQEAGRKVAKENALLRSLLILHGVSEEEIEKYLQSQATYIPSISSSAMATSHSPKAPSDPLVNYHHTCTTPMKLNSSPYQLDTTGTERSISKSTAERYMSLDTQSSGAERPAVLSSDASGTKVQQFSDDQGIGQFTSCENAARIIASLRNNPDIRDVRSELGCDSESNCMVKNMSIFDALDKGSG